MPVARISMMHMVPERRAEVAKLLAELEEFVSQQPGYVLGFQFANHEEENQLGRVSVWRTHEDADHAATLDHTMFLRSRLHMLIQAGHIEALVEITGDPKNLPI